MVSATHHIFLMLSLYHTLLFIYVSICIDITIYMFFINVCQIKLKQIMNDSRAKRLRRDAISLGWLSKDNNGFTHSNLSLEISSIYISLPHLHKR